MATCLDRGQQNVSPHSSFRRPPASGRGGEKRVRSYHVVECHSGPGRAKRDEKGCLNHDAGTRLESCRCRSLTRSPDATRNQYMVNREKGKPRTALCKPPAVARFPGHQWQLKVLPADRVPGWKPYHVTYNLCTVSMIVNFLSFFGYASEIKRFASSLPRRSVARMGPSPFSWVRRGLLLGLAPFSGMAMEQLWKVSSKSGARGNDRRPVS